MNMPCSVAIWSQIDYIVLATGCALLVEQFRSLAIRWRPIAHLERFRGRGFRYSAARSPD